LFTSFELNLSPAIGIRRTDVFEWHWEEYHGVDRREDGQDTPLDSASAVRHAPWRERGIACFTSHRSMRHAKSAQDTRRGNLGAVAGHHSGVRIVIGGGMAIRLDDRFAATSDAPQDAKT